GHVTGVQTCALPIYDQRIVFARQGRDTEGGGIFAVNSDGTGEGKIAPGFRDSRWPDWSPDGQKIAFTEASLAVTGYIDTVNPDRSEERRVGKEVGYR